MSLYTTFATGALTLGLWAAGLFFLRFWARSRDVLFALFAVAFWLMALNRILLMLVVTTREFHPHLYGLRLVAFLLIIAAIFHKNRRSSQQ